MEAVELVLEELELVDGGQHPGDYGYTDLDVAQKNAKKQLDDAKAKTDAAYTAKSTTTTYHGSSISFNAPVAGATGQAPSYTSSCGKANRDYDDAVKWEKTCQDHLESVSTMRERKRKSW